MCNPETEIVKETEKRTLLVENRDFSRPGIRSIGRRSTRVQVFGTAKFRIPILGQFCFSRPCIRPVGRGFSRGFDSGWYFPYLVKSILFLVLPNSNLLTI